MITIFKYPVPILDEQLIPMPSGAEILTAQLQNRNLCLWVKVETGNSPEDRIIRICGTGHPVPEGRYIASVIIGDFVWHVFEDKQTV
jgi:hypothetical protein